MSKYTSNTNSLGTVIKKFFLSGFVILSFLAYVLHERFTAATQPNNGNSNAPTQSNGAETVPVNRNSAATPITSDDDGAVAPADNATSTDGLFGSVGSSVADTPTPQPVTRGPIILQSEGAELFYRDVQVRAITAIPSEFARD